MGRYVVRRLIQAIPVVLGATLLIHAVVFALPGSPAVARAGADGLPPGAAALLREHYRLGEPFLVRYGHYLAGLFRGDLGVTFAGVPVADLLAGRFQVTVNLMMTALVVEAVAGVGLGLYGALRYGGARDALVLGVTLVLISVPALVTGFVLQLLLGVRLRQAGMGLFPVAGIAEGWRGYLLPGFVLAASSIAYLARLTRAGLLEALRADYIRTAVAKGLSRRRVVGLHALRNMLIPLITYLGADLGTLMGGTVITETVFNLPGVGRQLADSIHLREQPVIVGTVTFLVLVSILVNLVVDLLYAVLDPRIRHE